MVRQTSIEEFMTDFKEQEAKDGDNVGTGEYEERTTLKAQRDQVYSGYYIESYQSGIKGQYGDNTAVRITSPEGEKQTLWVNGFEEKHFLQFVSKAEGSDEVTLTTSENGNTELSAPLKVDFLRTQQESEAGNKYNRIMFVLKASGEEAEMELNSL